MIDATLILYNSATQGDLQDWLERGKCKSKLFEEE